jgi:hypothetical protein
MDPHSAPASNTDIARWKRRASVWAQKRRIIKWNRRKLFDDINAGGEPDDQNREYENEFHVANSLDSCFFPFAAKELTQG